jgi:hypothetical protein
VRQPHWLLRRIVRGLRILLGILLIIGGLFGFLPIVGFWMLPLGAIVLAREVPAVARLLERVQRRWRRDP